MSWINMLNGWQWLVMASVPPLIIMLYFLKLRRKPIEVPSTYLWKRTIEDLHVNSIWQRLRKNLLLLLQLLVLLALILACLRPGYRGDRKLGNRSVFLIDNSSSMQASDTPPNRLSEARKRAMDMVNAMGPDDVAMVIAFSDRADVKQGFTSDKKKLRNAIQAIEATNRTTDLNEALRAASGLANPGRTSQIDDMNDIQVAEAVPAKLIILSDGRFGPPQMDLGNLTAEFLPIGEPIVNNVGILAFTVERNLEKNGRVEAFARVQNFGAQVVNCRASLSLDGDLVDASDLELEPGNVQGVSFEIQDLTEGQLKLDLEVDDDFDVDNTAFAGLDPPRQLEVALVTAGNSALEAALSTEQASALASVQIIAPDSLESPEVQQLAQSGTIDLFIYDSCSPSKLPESNTLFIGSLPPQSSLANPAVVPPEGGSEAVNRGWKGTEPTGPLFVIDSNRSHPILQYVDLGTVRIVEGFALELPTGGTELIRTDTGILMGVAPREAYQDAVLGMALMRQSDDGVSANTDWPIKRSFPVFVLNSLEFLGGAVSTAGSKTVRPGQPAILNIASRFDQIDIRTPSGKKIRIDRMQQPQLIFTQTDEVGVYSAQPIDNERTLQMFTVNLFSEQESDLTPVPEVTIGSQNVAAQTNRTEIVRVEYWRWLLALALGLLSLEWYLYNRRVAV